jgi:hypothetical protein
MIWLFEVAGMAALGVVVWVLYKASRYRPDQPGLRVAAVIGLAAWAGFALLLLVNGGAFEDPMGLARNALILAVIVAAVMGYRRVLGLLRERAGGR